MIGIDGSMNHFWNRIIFPFHKRFFVVEQSSIKAEKIRIF